MTKAQKLQLFVWGLSTVSAGLAIYVWGSAYSWQLGSLSLYQLFPVFGLVAFSLMWSHYIAAAVRAYLGMDSVVLRDYFEVTSSLVLVSILLHPGLLAWQLWRDGAGLPPGSELNYVPPGYKWAILFGFTALTVFLLYELRRFFSHHSWWRFVQYASDVAMVLIFFHALSLGGQLQASWFRGLWYFYGITFVAAVAYGHFHKHTHKPAGKLPK